MTEIKKLNKGVEEDFTSLAAHQLRALLSSSAWFVNLLLSGKAGELNPEQHYLVENLSDVLKHNTEVVEVLLRLGRIQSGKIKIQPKSTDLKDLLEKVIASVKLIGEKKGVTIKLVVSKSDSWFVEIDSEFMWQMMEILLSNAIKYSQTGGIVEVLVEEMEKEIKISVKDSGIGIPLLDQDKIFEKFYRAKNAVILVPQGSGLGLSLAKSLAEAWGGTLGFQSSEDKGSVFYFTLPVKGMKAKDGQIALNT